MQIHSFSHPDNRDHQVALEAASAADEAANAIIAGTLQDMCDNDQQRIEAAAMITAAMLDRYESAMDTQPPGFRRAVEGIRSVFGPSFRKGLTVYQPSRWKRTVQLFSEHPLIGFLAMYGTGSLLSLVVTAAVKLAS